jgi:hypothetical protein
MRLLLDTHAFNPFRTFRVAVGPIGRRDMPDRELDLRDPRDRERLASAWLRYAESGEANHSWASESLSNLIDEDPALAWTIVLELVHHAPSDGAFDITAAGPLEDLIARHGEEMIDAIEMQVQGDETLRRALSRVLLSRDDLGPMTMDRFFNLGVQRIA